LKELFDIGEPRCKFSMERHIGKEGEGRENKKGKE